MAHLISMSMPVVEIHKRVTNRLIPKFIKKQKLPIKRLVL